MNFIDTIASIPLTTKVFLICFAFFSLVEIILALFEKNFFRKLIKPLCLMFLGIAVTIALPSHRFLYFATYLGMAGDILLISKRKKFLFPLGTFSFMLGHIFYYVEINTVLLPTLGLSMKWWFHVLYWSLVVVFTFIFFKPIKKAFQLKFFTGLGCSLYYMVLISSSVMYTIATIATFGTGITTYMWLAIIGIVFFIFSDIFLGYTTYVKEIKRRDFYIMLTYLVAECLIVLAFVLTYYSNPTVFTF